MKLSLYVLQGTAQGKTIPIGVPQFIIGRDPKCHLRPASPMISKRHCALLIREGKVYIRDFQSTNGSVVNGERVQIERELRDKDKLTLGPLAFEVRIQRPTPAPVDKPTPLPESKPAPAKAATVDEDQAIADMLLDIQEDQQVDLGGGGEPDQGSTILDLTAVAKAAQAAAAAAEAEAKKAEAKPEPKAEPKLEPKAEAKPEPVPKPVPKPVAAPKKASEPARKSETQSAAEAILAKMHRRNRK
jgi:predicted component of type VI protein secretion system